MARRPARLAYLWSRLDRFEALSVAAEGAASFTAAVAAEREAVKLRAEIDEIEQIRAAKKRRRRSRTLEESLDELLDVVREIRIAAVASGSCIAANQAVKLEGELITQKGVAVDAAAKAQRAAMSIEDIEAEIARLRAARGA